MPAQSEQVISSFLTQFAYEKLAVCATWLGLCLGDMQWEVAV
jgi:hypothetical protein